VTNEQFEDILLVRMAAVESMLVSKAGEYATDQDRLHNFKEAARLNSESPAEALMGMLVKHFVSLLDIARGKVVSFAVIDEKITDAMAYLVLLEAVLKEKANNTLDVLKERLESDDIAE
jgi:uncharacterized protein YbcI